MRSRDMSPESLRRFLSDDVPFAAPAAEPAPKLWIPDEIVEENEDDDGDMWDVVSEDGGTGRVQDASTERSEARKRPRLDEGPAPTR